MYSFQQFHFTALALKTPTAHAHPRPHTIRDTIHRWTATINLSSKLHKVICPLTLTQEVKEQGKRKGIFFLSQLNQQQQLWDYRARFPSRILGQVPRSCKWTVEPWAWQLTCKTGENQGSFSTCQGPQNKLQNKIPEWQNNEQFIWNVK